MSESAEHNKRVVSILVEAISSGDLAVLGHDVGYTVKR